MKLKSFLANISAFEPESESDLWLVMSINFSWVQIKMYILTNCAQSWSAEACLQALPCAHTPAAVWNHAGDSSESLEWMYQLGAIQSAQVNTVWWLILGFLIHIVVAINKDPHHTFILHPIFIKCCKATGWRRDLYECMFVCFYFVQRRRTNELVYSKRN